jgi:hypothetical protein
MSRRSDGITLFELILAILILGIAVPAVLNLLSSVARNYGQTENWLRANSLGRSLLEEILSKRFDERLSPSGGNWSTLGPDAGETGSSLYDDVDDFQGFSQTMASPLVGFTRSVQVTYLQSSGLQLLVDPSPSSPSPYKRITVTVTGPTGASVSLVGLATTANSQGASV